MSLDFTALDAKHPHQSPSGAMVSTIIDVDLPSCLCGYLNFNEVTGAALRNLLGLESQYGQMAIRGFRARIDAAQNQFGGRAPRALSAGEKRRREFVGPDRGVGARVIHVGHFTQDDLERRLITVEEFTIAAQKAGATHVSWT